MYLDEDTEEDEEELEIEVSVNKLFFSNNDWFIFNDHLPARFVVMQRTLNCEPQSVQNILSFLYDK